MARKTAKPDVAPALCVPELFILADYARDDGGKLDILGGGWIDLTVPEIPTQHECYVVAKLRGPLDHQAFPREIVIEITHEPEPDDEEPESARFTLYLDQPDPPAGKSSHIVATIIVQLTMEIRAPGRYRATLLQREVEMSRVHFSVRVADGPVRKNALIAPGKKRSTGNQE